MAGYSALYVVGEPGGYMGSDGVNPIHLLLLVGESDRQWVEPHYFDDAIVRLADVRAVVPARPDHPDLLLDSLIAFWPARFSSCPSFVAASAAVVGISRLDLSSPPAAWSALREEARALFGELHIWSAELRPVKGAV